MRTTTEQRTQHTPGPWTLTQYSTGAEIWGLVPVDQVYIPGERNQLIAHVYSNRDSDPNGNANVRLILAAPLLLAICEEIGSSGCDLGNSERRIRLYAALAKVEGRR